MLDLYDGESLGERIHGITIYVGDTLVDTVAYVSGQTIYSFDEIGLVGTQVTLYGQPIATYGYPQDGYINLAEVEVYGTRQGKFT